MIYSSYYGVIGFQQIVIFRKTGIGVQLIVAGHEDGIESGQTTCSKEKTANEALDQLSTLPTAGSI